MLLKNLFSFNLTYADSLIPSPFPPPLSPTTRQLAPLGPLILPACSGARVQWTDGNENTEVEWRKREKARESAMCVFVLTSGEELTDLAQGFVQDCVRVCS